MDFEQSIKQGFARVIQPDQNRAINLKKSAISIITTLENIELNQASSQLILRESYEAIRQLIESYAYHLGYKLDSHEVCTYFLKDKLNEEELSEIFERLRKLRNQISYYGKTIDISTAKQAKQSIALFEKKLL